MYIYIYEYKVSFLQFGLVVAHFWTNLFSLCETGYLWNLFAYLGKEEVATADNKRLEQYLNLRVIL